MKLSPSSSVSASVEDGSDNPSCSSTSIDWLVVLPPYLLCFHYALKASHLTFLLQLFLLFLVFPEIADLLVIVDQLVVEASLHILGKEPKTFPFAF